MGLVSHHRPRPPVAGVPVAAVLVTTLVTVLLTTLAGCGGSVADADSDSAPTTRAEPAQAAPFCTAVRADISALGPLNRLSVRDTVPPDQLAGTVDAVRRAGADLVDAAPAALRPDVQTTVNALGVQLDALVAAGGDASVAAGDPAVTAQSGSPEIAAAGRRVADYVSKNCRPPSS